MTMYSAPYVFHGQEPRWDDAQPGAQRCTECDAHVNRAGECDCTGYTDADPR